MSNKVRVFNGFIENAFPARHQTPGQMNVWRGRLEEAAPDLLTFERRSVEGTWLYQLVEEIERDTGSPVYSADHPNEPADRYATPRDAVRSQCILHERFRWLHDAAALHPHVDTWVWLEPTIFKQAGVTREVVEQFLQDIEDHPVDAISLPGVWEKQPIQDHINHWRFCGSCWVCPARFADPVYHAVRALVALRARLTGRLCWDNSTWSYLELLNVLPIRWYPGNHDQTQMTGYLTGLA